MLETEVSFFFLKEARLTTISSCPVSSVWFEDEGIPVFLSNQLSCLEKEGYWAYHYDVVTGFSRSSILERGRLGIYRAEG